MSFRILVSIVLSIPGIASVALAKTPPGIVEIPGGEFAMGSPGKDPHAHAVEKPAQKVMLSGFWMDATEVTNDQLAKFVKATGYVTKGEKKVDWHRL